jgi:hypothetical protein
MPLQATSGAASYDAFGGGVPVVPQYIEDVFSTYLYSGNDSTQTITNNIDISTKGALVWVKGRSGTYGTFDHTLITTPVSNTTALSSNTTGDSFGIGSSAFSPTTTGFNLNTASASLNNNGTNYASWTFRKQPKFFDIVTYTGNGTEPRNIAHNLGSVPACMIVKSTSAVGGWRTYHRSLGATQYLQLQSTNAAQTYPIFYDTEPTSTVFTVGVDANASGVTYVAYLFAHNAGGFGLTGTDNVISCGLTTANGSGDFSVNLGYEPQWVLIKSTGSGRWSIFDNMRGATASSGYTSSKRLQPQASDAEDQFDSPYGLGVNATGFTGNLATFSNDFIYIAIRRGPMKVPTSGTSVFSPSTASQNSGVIVSGFPVDATILASNSTAGFNSELYSRLAGGGYYQKTSAIDAEAYSGVPTMFQYNNGISPARFDPLCLTLMFQRAPSFMDVVCYTGTDAVRTISHNLTVAPELIIVKGRNTVPANSSFWTVYSQPTGNTNYLYLNNTTATSAFSGYWNNTSPTASVFTLGTGNGEDTNATGKNYVAYLFATCAGVSKVGSYTGTGALLTVNCGFTSGARYILIKRTDSTGDWFSYNSASGISSGTDPYLLLNSSAVQVTGTNYVDTDSTGFKVTAAAPSGLNASGGTYIFLAIA